MVRTGKKNGFERYFSEILTRSADFVGKIEKNLRNATRAELREEVAGPQWAGVRSAFPESIAYDLTPAQLATVFQEADNGDPKNLFILAQEIEERDPHYQSVLNVRKAAVKGLTFSVQPADTKLKSKKLAEEVQRLIDASAFRKAVPHFLDAIGKGFSVVEVVWDTTSTPWKPLRYIHQPQYNFRFDHKVARELLLVTTETPLGEELAEGKFIIHESMPTSSPLHRGGRCRTAAFFYLGKSYGMRGWLNFNELYGIPLKVVKHAPNASDDERSRILTAASAMGTGGVLAIPTTMSLEIEPGVSGSHGPETFGGLLDWIDSQISKLILGQTMTSDNGSSMSQAKVHNEVRQDILWADAEALADTINEQLIAPYIKFNYGADVEPPRLKVTQDENEDLVATSQALTPFIDRGLRVSAKEISDKFGLTEPDKVADALGLQAQPAALQQQPQTDVAMQSRESLNGIEKIAEEAAGYWQEVMDPLVQPMLDAANNSKSYDEFKTKLETVLSNADTEKVRASVAYNGFIQRAIGDVEARNGK